MREFTTANSAVRLGDFFASFASSVLYADKVTAFLKINCLYKVQYVQYV